MSNEELELRISELEQKFLELENRQNLLIVSKENNSQFPYWNIILELKISYEERTKIEYVLNILADRLDGDGLQISDSARSIYPNQLFSQEKPTTVELYNILSEITGRPKNILFDILTALYKQKMFYTLLKNMLF